MKLKDQTAIVTGGGRGIGRTIALTLAREGADVLVCGRHREGLESTAQEIEQLARRSSVVVADVSQESQVAAVVDSALQSFGRIDILVNNAGVAGPTAPVTNVTRKEWDEVLAVNLTSAFLCAKAVIPHMIQRQSGMIGLSATLAQELGPHNIQVNAICPGPTAGERMHAVIAGRARELGQSETEVERLYVEGTALKRMVDPEHVAAMVLLLVSDEGSSITGEAIDVSAGYGL